MAENQSNALFIILALKSIIGYWVILDQPIPSFTELVIEGTLELDHGPAKDNDLTIDVTYLYILGGRLIIGCEESAPYEGKASIVLRGDSNTAPYPVTEGPNVGSKVIGENTTSSSSQLHLYHTKCVFIYQ